MVRFQYLSDPLFLTSEITSSNSIGAIIVQLLFHAVGFD
jgi:hypothetical protein